MADSAPQVQTKAERELTPEAKAAVNSYLRRWLLSLGIVNLLFVFSSFIFVFFVLPKTAFVEAVNSIKTQTLEQQGIVTKFTTDAMLQAADSKSMSKRANDESEIAIKKIAEIQSALQKITNTNSNDLILNVAKVADTLSKNPKIAEGFDRVADVKDLSNRVIELESKTAKNHRIECKIVFRGQGTGIADVEYNQTCPSGYDHIMNSNIYSMGFVQQWQTLCCRVFLQ